ncbi:MAG: hypothetical protein AAF387_22425, partial [Pseudomonadota bacterium]
LEADGERRGTLLQTLLEGGVQVTAAGESGGVAPLDDHKLGFPSLRRMPASFDSAPIGPPSAALQTMQYFFSGEFMNLETLSRALAGCAPSSCVKLRYERMGLVRK